MKITLNDQSFEVEERITLQVFMDSLQRSLDGLAVAIDYEVVPRNTWDNVILVDGMSLIAIHAVSGG